MEDRNLVVSGRIAPAHLVTFRVGELALNPENGTIIELPCEMIKVRGLSDTTWQCRFYSHQESACLIYEYRPLECRRLKCWKPREVVDLFLKDLISRSMLIPQDNPIWDIIHAYESTFPVKAIMGLALEAKIQADAGRELEKLQMLDHQFRKKVGQIFNMEPTALDFFLGRPVSMIANGI